LPAVAVRELSIPGLFVVERPTHHDDRGFFREVVRWDELQEAIGRSFVPVQWNHSVSRPRVLRALHAEAWNKLVYPVTGTMFAAIVDIRPEAPTFGTVVEVTLDAREPRALFIPSGLANSICVVGDEPVHYLYLVDAYYDGTDTRAVAWDDPELAIEWPVADPIVSERDRANPTLRELVGDVPLDRGAVRPTGR
jgi:dTDP-4-dehydrorhamnose 3,5-epimerase